MTTSQQTQSPELPLEEKTVADYLRDNPEFFQNNASLLASLQIPHAVGPAVSLVEYQVRVLPWTWCMSPGTTIASMNACTS